ncbi:MAG: hypothetical protein WC758_02425 [Candidatus Woesearchaeota archaeon]|jgi:hypothetical protein
MNNTLTTILLTTQIFMQTQRVLPQIQHPILSTANIADNYTSNNLQNTLQLHAPLAHSYNLNNNTNNNDNNQTPSKQKEYFSLPIYFLKEDEILCPNTRHNFTKHNYK